MVTPWGGVAVLVQFLNENQIAFTEAVAGCLPIQFHSPNANAPVQTFTAFLIAVVSGARSFSHAALLRTDRALLQVLGLEHCPIDDTIRDLFKRFTQGKVYEVLLRTEQWELQRLPSRVEGYSLDQDSTVFERYGEEGALKGYKPRFLEQLPLPLPLHRGGQADPLDEAGSGSDSSLGGRSMKTSRSGSSTRGCWAGKLERRFVVVLERIREKRGAGKLLVEVPGYNCPHLRYFQPRSPGANRAGL